MSVDLGDEIVPEYSQVAIRNINILLKLLKKRLSSDGKAKATDGYGNVIYVDCDIYGIPTLVSFLELSLSEFNSCPKFTNFTFENKRFIEYFCHILVEGATLYALASKALVEKGRELNVSDNGIEFIPPSLSDLLQNQYNVLLEQYNIKLKEIKSEIDLWVEQFADN